MTWLWDLLVPLAPCIVPHQCYQCATHCHLCFVCPMSLLTLCNRKFAFQCSFFLIFWWKHCPWGHNRVEWWLPKPSSSKYCKVGLRWHGNLVCQAKLVRSHCREIALSKGYSTFAIELVTTSTKKERCLHPYAKNQLQKYFYITQCLDCCVTTFEYLGQC